jgi:hypothetical protein
MCKVSSYLTGNTLLLRYKDQPVNAGKQSLFIVRTIGNTQIHSVGRMQSFSMLKQVVHIESLGCKGLMAGFGNRGAEHSLRLLCKVRQRALNILNIVSLCYVESSGTAVCARMHTVKGVGPHGTLGERTSHVWCGFFYNHSANITQPVFRRRYVLFVGALELPADVEMAPKYTLPDGNRIVASFKNASIVSARCSFQQRSMMITAFNLQSVQSSRKHDCSVERTESFLTTAVPFPASAAVPFPAIESAVVSRIPSHQSLHAHIFKNTVKR